MVSWGICACFGAARYTVQNSAVVHSGAVRSDCPELCWRSQWCRSVWLSRTLLAFTVVPFGLTVQNSAGVHSGAVRSDCPELCSRSQWCRSVWLSVCRYVSPPVGLSVRLSVRQFACRSVCLSRQSACWSVCASVGPSVRLLVCLSLCRYVSSILNSFSLGYSITNLTSVIVLARELYKKARRRSWHTAKCKTEVSLSINGWITANYSVSRPQFSPPSCNL